MPIKVPLAFLRLSRPPPRPTLDPATTERLALHSTDDLRELHHNGRTDFPLNDVKAEILWRVWHEDLISKLTLWVAVIGAVAAIIGAVAATIAVIEGWR